MNGHTRSVIALVVFVGLAVVATAGAWHWHDAHFDRPDTGKAPGCPLCASLHQQATEPEATLIGPPVGIVSGVAGSSPVLAPSAPERATAPSRGPPQLSACA